MVNEGLVWIYGPQLPFFWQLTKLRSTGAVQKSPSPGVKAKQGETSSPLSWTMKRFLEPASRVKGLDATQTVCFK